MPRKRALLIGINDYHPAIGPLAGCVNDVRQVESLLLERFSFPKEETRQLVDHEATRDAILDGLDWLIKGSQAGDVRVLFYAGHGTRLPNPRDPSGKDEVLVAFSPEWEKLLASKRDASVIFLPENWDLQFIRDKEIKAHLGALTDGVNLTLVMDCCYSGDVNRDTRTFPRFLEPPPSIQNAINEAVQAYWHHKHEGEKDDLNGLKFSGEQAKHLLQKALRGNHFELVDTREKNILLAACSEKETALERSFNGQRGGVFTHYLTDALRSQEGTLTYADLIDTLGKKMRFTITPQMPRLACPERYRQQKVFAPLVSK